MSIALMTKAWKVGGISATKKLVLLALCDWANDEGGSLHPSMTRIAQRAGCSERQAQRVVHELIAEGFLTVIGNEFGGKPGQSRQYQLNVEKLETGDTDVTGVNLSRVTNKAKTGDICDTRRVTFEAETGDTDVTLTTIEPSIEPSRNHQGRRVRATPPAKPDGVAEQVWVDWLELRKAKRAPVTQTVLDDAKREAGKAGVTLDAFLREWCARGSQGLKAAWLAERAPSASTHGFVGKQQALEAHNRAVADEWVRKMEGQHAEI